MKKIKVLWISNAFDCGGAQKQIAYMSKIVKQFTNIESTILFYAKGKEIIDEEVETVFYDKEKLGKRGLIKAIRKYIKENDIQIVHAYGAGTANIYGRRAAKHTKAITVGAMLGKNMLSKFSHRLTNSIINLSGNWWTVNNSELTPILKRNLWFMSNKKIRLIHNGYPPAEKVDYKTNEITDYDLEKGNDFIFTVVGRLDPVKNYKLFVRAAKEICKEYENVKFWIVGNGSEYENLVDLANKLEISDKIKFWGFRRDIDIVMSRSDVFMQTSFTEGTPNTVCEAMRAKKPLISTKSCDLSEMIDEGKNGYVVPVDNLEELVAAMKKMLSKSKAELQEMGNRSIEMFNATYLDEKIAKELLDFYREVLGQEN